MLGYDLNEEIRKKVEINKTRTYEKINGVNIRKKKDILLTK